MFGSLYETDDDEHRYNRDSNRIARVGRKQPAARNEQDKKCQNCFPQSAYDVLYD